MEIVHVEAARVAGEETMALFNVRTVCQCCLDLGTRLSDDAGRGLGGVAKGGVVEEFVQVFVQVFVDEPTELSAARVGYAHGRLQALTPGLGHTLVGGL